MLRKILIGAGIIVALGAAGSVLLAAKETVREPAVAGAFYPAGQAELAGVVDGYLAKAGHRPGQGRLIALVAPHAGYQYSGQVAAFSYRHLGDRPVDTVILIGSSHYASFAGAAVSPDGAWRTPLGDVRISGPITRSLVNKDAGVTANREAFAKEHSLEVQLPFLQRTAAKDLTIVPILLGAPTRDSFDHLAGKLTEVLRKNDRAIIIASTDLSHYHSADAAVVKDRKVIDAMARMSVEDLEALLVRGDGEACGGHAVLLTMMVSRNLGATHGVLYDRKNSGDLSGDRSRVVGYAALGFYRSQLSAAQRTELLGLARRTVTQYVRDRSTPEPDGRDPRLQAHGATFVTINRHHQLRGCIGTIQPNMPLERSVIRNAVAAATQDPRFPPMRPEELGDMEVEVTVLSPLEPLDDVKSITVGIHGVYLVKDGRSAIFLPQVPVEQGWDLTTYLDQLCLKAGLPAKAWKDRDAKLSIFTADIIK